MQEDHGNLQESHETLAAGDPICDAGAEQTGQTRQQMPERKKGRKDLFGIGNAIDRFATNAITGNKAATLAKKYKELLEDAGLSLGLKGMNSDSIHNQRVLSIVVGSLRAHDRLKEAGSSTLKNVAIAAIAMQHLGTSCGNVKGGRTKGSPTSMRFRPTLRKLLKGALAVGKG